MEAKNWTVQNPFCRDWHQQAQLFQVAEAWGVSIPTAGSLSNVSGVSSGVRSQWQQ